jgi:flagellar motor switch/type III secretory pathway protein FliN
VTNIRPIQVLTASGLSAVRAAADAALGPWMPHWFAGGTAVSIDCAPMDLPPVDQAAAAAWLCCKTTSADIWLDAAAVAVIGSALFGSETAAAIGAAVARSAAGDLLMRLSADSAARVSEAQAPQHLWQAGRCVVAVTIKIGDKHGAVVTLLVEKHAASHVAAQLDATRSPLQSVKALVRDQMVEIEVSLGQVEVELGVLRSLAVGDVLRLDRALDAGADVRVCGNRVGCVGFLGARDGQRAVALARA